MGFFDSLFGTGPAPVNDRGVQADITPHEDEQEDDGPRGWYLFGGGTNADDSHW